MFRSRLSFSAIALLLSLSMTMMTACSAPAAKEALADASAVSAIDVQVTQAKRADLKRETEFSGRVESGSSVNIYAEVPAKILNVYKNAGEYVQAGELLMEVDDTDVQTSLETAQSALAASQLTLEQTRAQQAISASGSGYLTKQLSNEKSLTDLLDQYYDSLRSGNKLNCTLDEYTARLWDAVSAKNKAKEAYDAFSKTMSGTIHGFYTRYQAIGSDGRITESIFTQYMTGSTTAQMSYIITTTLEKDPILNQAVSDFKASLVKLTSALSSATSAEAQMKTALETYEKQYDTSKTTIDSSIRTITKNYDYYSKTIGISETLGRNETSNLNALTLATLQLSCDNAQRNVDTATRKLEKCKLYAPVSGTVITKNAVASNFASSAQPMFVIAADDTAPQITFNLSETGADALFVGASVTAIINGEAFTATVTEIANATTAGGLYAAKAVLPVDAGIERTGAVVKVRAATAQTNNAVVLPLTYIQYDGNQPYVLVVENGKAVRRDVSLGMTTHDEAEILRGVDEYDNIITTWHPELKDGSAVSCAALGVTASPSAADSIEVIE